MKQESIAAVLLAAMVVLGATPANATPQWQPAPRLDQCSPPSPSCTGRVGHAAALLANGKVLIVGGTGLQPGAGPAPETAQLYDPVKKGWAPTGSPNRAAPRLHTLTALANGKALLVRSDGPAELYDVACGTWTTVGAPPRAHGQHSASLLKDGRVLIAGGLGGEGRTGTASADVYDPVTNRWSPTGSMIQLRYQHAAAVLPDGKVLVVAGYSDNYGPKRNTAELYDPATGTWAPTGALPQGYTPIDATATVLGDGQVLVAGGESGPNGTNSGFGGDRMAQLYDPGTGTWNATAAPNAGHSLHTATLLPDGTVLIVGGTVTLARREGEQPPQSSAEIYDPQARTWAFAPNPKLPRSAHTATRLLDGTVIVAGGRTVANTVEVSSEADAEIYNSEVPVSSPNVLPEPAGSCHDQAAAPNRKGTTESRAPFIVAITGCVVVAGVVVAAWRRRKTRPSALAP